ncbi:MAG: DEAD/DEAH box helicase [Bacteroidales bacterium]|jgi:SNF2 family DNA or RNA helicase
MQYKAHDYQEYAKQKIIEQKACGLFLEPGLGKTVITLSAIWDLMFDYFDISKVLVIAPLRVAENTWTEELEKWDHLTYLRISKVLGTEAQRIEALRRPADIYVINRENVAWLAELGEWDFDMLVIDELSSFKNASSKRFKALRRKRPGIDRVVGLTGTPSTNGLMDLWSEIYLLDQGKRLGKTLSSYRADFFVPDRMNGFVVYSYKPKPGAEEWIYSILSSLCVSMKSQDFLQMPERLERDVTVKLPPVAKGKYKELEREMVAKLEGKTVDAVNAAVLTNKLLQMASGAVYDENKDVAELHSAKLDALEDLIEAANGKPVLIYYNYRHDKERIQKRFKEAQEIKTPEDFQAWNRGEIPVAIAHPASMGHGLNLQHGGSTVIWFSLPWSLELYQQANARLWRQGQKDTVVIFRLLSEGTIDRDVVRALTKKDLTQENLMRAVKSRVGDDTY